MKDQDVDALVARVRATLGIPKMKPEAKRGAEAYLQAYSIVADGNSRTPAIMLRMDAVVYIRMTASPPLTPIQWKAAHMVRRRFARLRPIW